MLRVSSFLLVASCALAQWPQWGGPNRDFKVDSPPLAEAWPAAGPKKLWTRPLGEGFSGIVVSDGRLFTMYNRGAHGQSSGEEVVAAMDAATGQTLWEYAYRQSFTNDAEVGPGPNASPLVDGDRVYSVGVMGKLHCFDAKTGKVRWMHDLSSEHNASFLKYGYASSPLVYKDKLIVPIGGDHYALMAYDKMTGGELWHGGSFTNAYSSPLLINVDGQDQVITVMKQDVMAMNLENAFVLWWYGQRAEYGLNVSMPVWGPDNLLFLSSSYGAGSRVLELHQSGGKTTVKELWSGYKLHIHHANAVRVGEVIYGSSGDSSPAPLTAVDVRTGKVLWQDRQFSKANIVIADGKAILLDQDGNLALAVVSPSGCRVLAKAQVLERISWTPPTLAGTKLYIRDRKTLSAFELAK